MEGLLASAEESVKQIPNFQLAQSIYEYRLSPSANMKEKIIEFIRDDSMGKYYAALCAELEWEFNGDFHSTMIEKNTKDLEEIENKLIDAKENHGDMEVLDIMFKKARHLSQVGDWDTANSAFDEIIKKDKVSTGKKIEAKLEQIRIFLFNNDIPKIKENIAAAKVLIDKGGDWDKRNRLKVYEGLYFLMIRDIKSASPVLFDCIATFSCPELCTYTKFMFYALIANIMTVSRIDLTKKIVNNPHVIGVIRDLPNIQNLLKSIYNCEYSKFFESLLTIHPDILSDRYIGPHVTYIVREYRILAYSQFLEAYKSVMISSMAHSFGLSVALLDSELSKFISSGRLNAKIDKVGDVIETSRADKKNEQYGDVIKKGDMLLNSIQKLVRLIDV